VVDTRARSSTNELSSLSGFDTRLGRDDEKNDDEETEEEEGKACATLEIKKSRWEVACTEPVWWARDLTLLASV
jgi:hypothetical protein